MKSRELDTTQRPVEKKRTRVWIILGTIGVGIALVVATAVVVLLHKLESYIDPYQKQVAAAGYVQKTAQVNQVKLSYVEGPNNGPPLLLLHAQFLDWFSYSRVLPGLARLFHVFDVDYPGHGKTTTPADYPMSANQIGADLGSFIERQIGEPVYVTGNSSGGLLAGVSPDQADCRKPGFRDQLQGGYARPPRRFPVVLGPRQCRVLQEERWPRHSVPSHRSGPRL